MENEDKNSISYITKTNKLSKNNEYTLQDAILEFEELKNIALNCVDKNGNPNISAALRAAENKAKIAGLYKNIKTNTQTVLNMGEIKINGEQLKLKIGGIFNISGHVIFISQNLHLFLASIARR